jgi:(5-formylfuran-3-yl)methyl phosphate synthase
MTQMLASVVNVEEALIALEAEVDIIDLKNPAQGALGALPLSVIREVVVAIAGRAPVSATIGDLPMLPELLVKAAMEVAETGVDIVKIGFFGEDRHIACMEALQPLAADGIRLVAVMMADQQVNFGLLPQFKQAGFYGVMLDTALKKGKNLLSSISIAQAQAFVDKAYELNMISGLAGSLGLTEIPVLLELAPTYLGFRGAICQNKERVSSINLKSVVEIRHALRKNNKMSSKMLSNVNYV